jgi:hypothetical protein
MRLANKKLIERLQARTNAYFYGDTATITYRTASTYDSYGQVTYSESTDTVSCSFTDKPSQEAWAEYADIENIQAELRFVGTKPSKGDRVTLTHRFDRNDADDQDYTALTFEIVGVKDRDVFGYIVALKKVAI